jgi:acetyl esterase
MPVLTALQPFLTAMIASTPTPERPVAEARAARHAMVDASFGALLAQHAPAASEQDLSIPVPGGQITIRVYSPPPTNSPLPCHLHLHGGGFWLGTLDQSDSACRGLASGAGCVVVSVDYRLAPEHIFPTAPEDCYAALLWVANHADSLGIDRARISIGGASAGATLATVVSLMARDRGGPGLVLQVLEIPVTDFTDADPICMTEDGRLVPSGKERYRAYYLADLAEAANPYASPLLAADLSGLPPALVMCAEYDPLRVEGEAYVKQLKDAGVSVEYQCWPGQFHGSQHLASLIPNEVAALENLVVRALNRSYGTLADGITNRQ